MTDVDTEVDMDHERPIVWTPVSKKYVPAGRSAEFLTALAETTWHEIGGDHPMSPALALQSIIKDFGVRGVTHVGYSEPWYAHDTTYEAPTGWEEPDVIGTYTILALRTRQIDMYWLDLGIGYCPIVILDREVP